MDGGGPAEVHTAYKKLLCRGCVRVAPTPEDWCMPSDRCPAMRSPVAESACHSRLSHHDMLMAEASGRYYEAYMYLCNKRLP
eukprot:364265-Chlamydomonas_euryale.AAC.14